MRAAWSLFARLLMNPVDCSILLAAILAIAAALALLERGQDLLGAPPSIGHLPAGRYDDGASTRRLPEDW